MQVLCTKQGTKAVSNNQREGGEGKGSGWGDTRTRVADSCWWMAKATIHLHNYCKVSSLQLKTKNKKPLVRPSPLKTSDSNLLKGIITPIVTLAITCIWRYRQLRENTVLLYSQYYVKCLQRNHMPDCEVCLGTDSFILLLYRYYFSWLDYLRT